MMKTEKKVTSYHYLSCTFRKQNFSVIRCPRISPRQSITNLSDVASRDWPPIFQGVTSRQRLSLMRYQSCCCHTVQDTWCRCSGVRSSRRHAISATVESATNQPGDNQLGDTSRSIRRQFISCLSLYICRLVRNRHIHFGTSLVQRYHKFGDPMHNKDVT